MGTLYIVPTPLGNLEDITLRALRILREVALIAAEDTRTTARLLNHFEIRCPLVSYHEHGGPAQVERVLATLAEDDVALLSEAGTPLLSDPGYRLVEAAIARQIPVTPLPGPSAITTALSAGGLPTDRFLFAGFLPRKKSERRRTLAELAGQQATLIFFELPHRLRVALDDIAAALGQERRVALCRELTKLHEEIWRGTVQEAQAEFAVREPRGEFTLLIEGAPPPPGWTQAEIEDALTTALQAGHTPKDAVRQVTAASDWSKRDVYNLVEVIKQTVQE